MIEGDDPERGEGERLLRGGDVEARDEEDHVDVGGDDLLLGGIAGGAPRELAEARQDRADARVAAGRGPLEDDPVADGREIGPSLGGVTKPSGHAREMLARRGDDAVDVRVLERDARRLDALAAERLEGLSEPRAPAERVERHVSAKC